MNTVTATRTADAIKTHLKEVATNFMNELQDHDCDCMDAPWHYPDGEWTDVEGTGRTDDFDDPSNHSQYCPFYIRGYLLALANDTELPA